MYYLNACKWVEIHYYGLDMQTKRTPTQLMAWSSCLQQVTTYPNTDGSLSFDSYNSPKDKD